ncbi:MAG: Ig-like domain-containing protein [Lachnospiraceae bacterium]|nr:Ig-like domain-containing protein [Lachnospiraceae bacterium]MDE6251668.1 Ig-like domain-containing protein [Lachnospiraceae bacterium]
MKNIIKKITTIIMVIAITLTLINPMTVKAASKAKTLSLNKKSITLTITNTNAKPSATLKVKNANKTVKWSNSNKKVITVQKTGKYSVKLTAKKAGKATITCKANNKKLTCKVTVINKKCKHKWTDCRKTFGKGKDAKKLPVFVYHKGLNGCQSYKNGNFTVFNGCGRCGIIYKNANTYTKLTSLMNVMRVMGKWKNCSHTYATMSCQKGNNERPIPKGYWLVATKKCTKCGEYAE